MTYKDEMSGRRRRFSRSLIRAYLICGSVI